MLYFEDHINYSPWTELGVLGASPNAAEPQDAGVTGVADLGGVRLLGHGSVKDVLLISAASGR
jgi:hypothetical protein